MAWPPEVVSALKERLGPSWAIHLAMPPITLGGSMVDVAEFHRSDGSVIYATAGASTPNADGTLELALHCSTADDRLVELMSRLGAMAWHGQLGDGHTIPLAGPPDSPPPFAGLGMLYWETLEIRDTNVRLLQVFGLTAEELAAARVNELRTIDEALALDRRGRVSTPGRATTPSLAQLVPVRPSDEQTEGMSAEARQIIDAIIKDKANDVEQLRQSFSEDDARRIAQLLGPRLPIPPQLATLLHALMDYTLEEMRVPCNRLLQLDPAGPMAHEYYRDALALLAKLDGGSWSEAYQRFNDEQAARSEAARIRQRAKLPTAWGRRDHFCLTSTTPVAPPKAPPKPAPEPPAMPLPMERRWEIPMDLSHPTRTPSMVHDDLLIYSCDKGVAGVSIVDGAVRWTYALAGELVGCFLGARGPLLFMRDADQLDLVLGLDWAGQERWIQLAPVSFTFRDLDAAGDRLLLHGHKAGHGGAAVVMSDIDGSVLFETSECGSKSRLYGTGIVTVSHRSSNPDIKIVAPGAEPRLLLRGNFVLYRVSGDIAYLGRDDDHNPRAFQAMNLRSGERLWSHDIDNGLSCFPDDDRVIVQEYDDEEDTVRAVCAIHAQTGELLWRTPIDFIPYGMVEFSRVGTHILMNYAADGLAAFRREDGTMIARDDAANVGHSVAVVSGDTVLCCKFQQVTAYRWNA